MNKTDYAIWGLLCMALPQETSKWNYEGKALDAIKDIKRIKMLSKKHQIICTWLCNGTKANSNNYQLQEKYRYNKEQFDIDIDKIETKIKNITKNFDFIIEYQYDPRGATIKLLYKFEQYTKNITDVLYL
jgi:hypothetical protein